MKRTRTHHRWTRWLVAIGVGVVMGAQAAPTHAGESSPYYFPYAPGSANPAERVPGVLGLSIGPVVAEADSDNWTLEDILRFADSGKWSSLPPGDERLRFATSAGIAINVLGLRLHGAAVGQGSGILTEDFVEIMKAAEAGSNRTVSNANLDGFGLRSALWSEVGARGSIAVPFIGRLVGLRSVRLGAGIRALQGRSFIESTGSGATGNGQAAITTYTARSGSGTAFDVGLGAEVRPNLSVEIGYLGAGSITWNDVEQQVTSESGGQFTPQTPTRVGSITRDLAATAYAGLRWRVFGPLELAAAYARLGANLPGAVTRISGEARFNLWVVRTALGVVQDEGSPSRMYARLGLGPLNVGLYNLEEALKGAQGKTLGVAAQLSLGL